MSLKFDQRIELVRSMFGFLLGWQKASKCKRVVKQLQCRLKLLKKKKYAISSHLRHDIAQLLRVGERDRALRRAQYLFFDENLMSLYHLLLHFSDFILLHISYIRKHRDLPDGDINETVSTLVFASARCGDLPELRTLRLLFVERYGQPFVSTALHLLPGNHVNSQIKEKLSIISVSDDAKSKLLGEIAAENGLGLEVHKQVKDSEEAEEEKEVKQDERKVCDEDDYCIEEEEVVEKDQRVFRFRKTEEERKKRLRRRSSRSPMDKDVECWRYYMGRRRRQKKECGQCYHIVYNVFTMWPDQKYKGQGERGFKEAKQVHPKLPDCHHIAAHFTALRRQQHMGWP